MFPEWQPKGLKGRKRQNHQAWQPKGYKDRKRQNPHLWRSMVGLPFVAFVQSCGHVTNKEWLAFKAQPTDIFCIYIVNKLQFYLILLKLMYLIMLEKFVLVVTCHVSMHVIYARRAYILSTLQQRIEESIIHQPTTHTYCNTVILVHVD